MLKLSKHEVVMTRAQLVKANRLAGTLAKHRDLAAKHGQTDLTRALTRLSKNMETITKGIDRFLMLTLWQVVILVTCVEAYLRDALAEAARIDPKLMSTSDQSALYADIVAATSIEDLATEMRARWARGWLREGGPTRWISRLGKMGAKGFPVDLAPRLERFWGNTMPADLNNLSDALEENRTYEPEKRVCIESDSYLQF